MDSYRIITEHLKVSTNGRAKTYHIQYKGWLGWKNKRKPNGGELYFMSYKEAETYFLDWYYSLKRAESLLQSGNYYFLKWEPSQLPAPR